MPTRFNPTDITASYQAVADLNNNFDEIATLFDLCVLRDGSAPNALLDDLDANHFKIQNVADGVADSDAASVGQVTDLISALSFLPTWSFANPAMAGGKGYIQAVGADPTSHPGDIVFEY
jgi:hypothetical protein